MSATIQTLKGRGSNGESVSIYPNTLIEAISNQKGEKLQDVIDNSIKDSESTIREHIADQFDNADLNADNITKGTLDADRLPDSGVVAGSYGQSDNASPSYNGTFSVPNITIDKTGRITQVSNKIITMPTDNSPAGLNLGLVKSGGDVTISNGVISVNDDSHNHNQLTGWSDTREVASIPNDYNNKLAVTGIKTPSVVGGTSDNFGSYITLMGIRGWTDKSGGDTHELGFAANGTLWHRHGSDTGFGSWGKVYTSQDKPTLSELGAAAASHGTHVSYGTSTKALGTSSAGSASTVSRSDHVHALPALTSCTGTLSVAKGGTGATTAADALTNLGLTATAAELNYMDGVTSNVQTQLNNKTKRISLTGQIQTTSYRRSVIALCNVTAAANNSKDSYSIGKISFHRTNGLQGVVTADVMMECQYAGANTANASILVTGTSSSNIRPCTFKYNGVTYGGIEVYIAAAEFSIVEFNGATNFSIFGLDYYKETDGTNAASVLNSEVNNSINFTDISYKNNMYYNGTKVALVSDNVTSATKDASGNTITSTYETKTDAMAKLTEARTYADTVANAVKNNLLNGAGSAYDTLKELGVLIDDNQDAIEALETIAAGKQANITGAATTVTSSNLTANRALISNSSGKIAVSAVTDTELGYLDGVTSAIQTQLNNKASSTHSHNEATTSAKGFMSVTDKTFVDKLKMTDFGAMTNKTITDLQTAIVNWLGTHGNIPNATAYFTANPTFIDYWNNNDTNSLMQAGGRYTIEVCGTYTSANYTLLRLTTYSAKSVYYVHRSNGTWGKIYKATFTDHTHIVTHTPEGSVSSTFTGTAATSGTPSGTSSVASSTHTHKYTAKGTVSQPTFTGTAVTSGASSGTTSVYSITGVGSVPSLSASVTNQCLILSFNAGSVPTRSSVTLPSTSHTHSVTAKGTVSQPTFTGTETDTTSISGTTSVASSGHTHSVTAKGSVSSTFTGTKATLTSGATS